MMLHLQGVLSKQQVAQCREILDAAPWIDGNATSGEQSAQAKRNQQLPEGSPAARAMTSSSDHAGRCSPSSAASTSATRTTGLRPIRPMGT